MSDVLRLENITRRYKEGEGQLEVFSGLNLSLHAGEIVALVGQSGAGKSSLLHIAGLLEAPTGGEIFVGGAATSRLNDAERTRIRRNTIGFVYQAHHLLPEFDDFVVAPVLPPTPCLHHNQSRSGGELLLEFTGAGEPLFVGERDQRASDLTAVAINAIEVASIRGISRHEGRRVSRSVFHVKLSYFVNC